MVDVEQSFWIQQRIKQNVSKCSDQGSQLNMRCFVCGDSRKNQSKRRGYYYKTTCSYYCFNCGTHLHGVKIVSTLENRPFKEVKSEYLMERYGKSFKVKKEKYKKPKFELKLNEFTNKLPEDVFRYLDERKIFDAPFLSEDAEFLYDEKTNRLVIPWYLDDKVVYYQKRTLDEKQQPKYLFPFGVDKSVYNIDRVVAETEKSINRTCAMNMPTKITSRSDAQSNASRAIMSANTNAALSAFGAVTISSRGKRSARPASAR